MVVIWCSHIIQLALPASGALKERTRMGLTFLGEHPPQEAPSLDLDFV